MNVMYKVKPIFGSEEIVLPDNMYYVKPIADAESELAKSCGVDQSARKSPSAHQHPSNNAVNPSRVVEGEKGKNFTSIGKMTPADRMTTAKETKDQKHGKKSKKGKNSGSDGKDNSGSSKDDGQSSSKDTSDGNKHSKKDEKEDEGHLIPQIIEDVPYLGNIIGDYIVEDIAIQADFDYKPLRVLKVINHLRKNFGLKIAVKVHISSTVLVESEINVDEWKMFETFESTILPRQDNQLVVSLIVKRYTIKEAWLNKQPFMILDPHLGTAIYGEVNIARHITRSAAKYCPPCYEIYPEADSTQVEIVKDIDETLNEIQKFLFIRDLQDKQARPSIPEIKDKRLKDNSDLDLKLTLDYILLLSLKL